MCTLMSIRASTNMSLHLQSYFRSNDKIGICSLAYGRYTIHSIVMRVCSAKHLAAVRQPDIAGLKPAVATLYMIGWLL